MGKKWELAFRSLGGGAGDIYGLSARDEKGNEEVLTAWKLKAGEMLTKAELEEIDRIAEEIERGEFDPANREHAESVQHRMIAAANGQTVAEPKQQYEDDPYKRIASFFYK